MQIRYASAKSSISWMFLPSSRGKLFWVLSCGMRCSYRTSLCKIPLAIISRSLLASMCSLCLLRRALGDEVLLANAFGSPQEIARSHKWVVSLSVKGMLSAWQRLKIVQYISRTTTFGHVISPMLHAQSTPVWSYPIRETPLHTQLTERQIELRTDSKLQTGLTLACHSQCDFILYWFSYRF